MRAGKFLGFYKADGLASPIHRSILVGVNRALLHTVVAGLALLAGAALAHSQPQGKAAGKAANKKVVVIPVRSQIDKPALYILRRGLKEAISAEVNTVVIDMETPGGRLDVTFDILKAIEKFPGKTITYINSEAISAGALISAGTDEIWFAPKGVIGAAAPVMAGGGEIDSTMRKKIVSYLKARIRAITEGRGYRAEVISAMVDSEMELKIGEEVIKAEGELLSLTASESTQLYGDPPVSLLGAGTAESIGELLDQIHGKGNYSVKRYEPSWSEELAQYLTAITPALLAFGLLGLFIEFKTPGFGIFGVGGLILLAIVLFGHHVAGLSGYEPMLLLLLGLVLIAIEVFIFPGSIVFGITGAILVLASLIWAMLDIWPNQALEIDSEMLMRPLVHLTLGVAGAVVLFIALLRFLPGGGPWGGMILQAAVAGEPGSIRPVNAAAPDGSEQKDLVGSEAIAATDLYPSGQVTIDGKRYEARLEVGTVDAGTRLVVTRASQFGLIVEQASTQEEAKS